MSVTAVAYANIAFAKYWGKRRAEGNYPSTDSVGVCLEALASRTTVRALETHEDTTDRFILDGAAASGKALARTSGFLDLVRGMAGISTRFEVAAENSFPTAAGLASSASGFAALALAASLAAGLTLTERELSILARRGSGSAARSIPPGFVRMLAGEVEPYAVSLAPPEALPVRFAIGVVGEGEKEVSSRDGMAHCAATSPYHPSWLTRAAEDAEAVTQAILSGDLQSLGELAEANALAMHADGFAAIPPLVYFQGITLEVLHLAQELRRQGSLVYFTCDAGPHPILFFEPSAETTVRQALEGVSGLKNVLFTGPTTGAALGTITK